METVVEVILVQVKVVEKQVDEVEAMGVVSEGGGSHEGAVIGSGECDWWRRRQRRQR